MLNQELIEDIALWYEVRKSTTYVPTLTSELLMEELIEFEQANTPVDRLDAICDMAFICVGALYQMKKLSELTECNNISLNRSLETQVERFIEISDDLRSASNLVCIIDTLIFLSGLSQEDFNTALGIVCSSNHTKTTLPIPPGKKYSVDGKGADYVPPEPKLKKFLELKP